MLPIGRESSDGKWCVRTCTYVLLYKCHVRDLYALYGEEYTVVNEQSMSM